MRAQEFTPSKLVIFDIDDTLVHTQTKVHVVKDGQVVNSLNSHEFTHYKLQPGEQFDFENFRNAHDFFHKSKPIIPMLNQLKQDIATGNKVVMVTARADFDDRELFLDTFRKYGVDMGKVHVYRAGNMTGKMQTEEKKKIIIRELLNKGRYTKAIMYDDAEPNLQSFVELKAEYPKTKFYAWHVSLEGDASEYHRTNEGQTLEEHRKKKRKSRNAAYGPGLFGGYGYFSNYGNTDSVIDSGGGDGGGDGGGESIEHENFADGRNPDDQVRNKLNAWMEQDQQFTDPTQRDRFQAKVWPYIQKNIQSILSDKGEKGNGDYPAAPYASWLLVQHMDAYPQNQIKFYKALKQAIPDHPKIQFLRDRAAVNQWILKLNDPKKYIDKHGKPLTNPTADVRDPSKFDDAGIEYTSAADALKGAISAGNTLLVDAVKKSRATTQPSYKQGVTENFADGRNPGRKGLAKRSGVNTKASVSSLRKTAKNSSGEKARMAHWMANMKSGRAKK